MLTSWRPLSKGQRITKVIRLHHLGTINICATSHSNPCTSCWVISVQTESGGPTTNRLTLPSNAASMAKTFQTISGLSLRAVFEPQAGSCLLPRALHSCSAKQRARHDSIQRFSGCEEGVGFIGKGTADEKIRKKWQKETKMTNSKFVFLSLWLNTPHFLVPGVGDKGRRWYKKMCRRDTRSKKKGRWISETRRVTCETEGYCFLGAQDKNLRQTKAEGSNPEREQIKNRGRDWEIL